MVRKQRIYERLPGKRLAVFAPHSLWQGPDHLLWVQASMVRERYKRFYYDEIQSIVLQRNNKYQLWNFIWVIVALLFLMIALIVPGTPYMSGLSFTIALTALLINLGSGPTCTVFLQTAVQVEKLSSLTRTRSARKALDQIKKLVHEAQGQMNLDNLAVNGPDGSTLQSGQMVLTGVPEPAANSRPRAVAEPFKPLLHIILFVVLLGAGVCRVIQLWVQHTALALADHLFLAATLAMVLIALVRWFHQVKGTLLAKITWLTLALTMAHSLTSYVFYILGSIRNPSTAQNEWTLLKQFFSLQMSDDPAARSAGMILAIASLGLGAAGLLATMRKKAE